MRRVAALVGIAVGGALLLTVAVTMWLWRNQERVVFQPPTVGASAPSRARRVEFRAADGHGTLGYVIEPRERSVRDAPVVIAFHGNADLAVWYVPWAHELAERTGVRVFVPEYRGYGGVDGTPTYQSAGSDAAGALRYARETLGARRIVLFGHSLGSAIASDLALSMQPDPPAVMVLQSPFTSAQEMATRMLLPPIPWLWRRVSRVHYDTRRIVGTLTCPVFVAHGTRDVLVPVRMGRQVFASARVPGRLLLVDGAGHNDVAEAGGERYWTWISDAVGAARADADDDQRRSENSRKKATGTFHDS